MITQCRIIAYLDTWVEDPSPVHGSTPRPEIWKVFPTHLITSICCYYGIECSLDYGPGSIALTVKDLVQELTKSPKKTFWRLEACCCHRDTTFLLNDSSTNVISSPHCTDHQPDDFVMLTKFSKKCSENVLRKSLTVPKLSQFTLFRIFTHWKTT